VSLTIERIRELEQIVQASQTRIAHLRDQLETLLEKRTHVKYPDDVPRGTNKRVIMTCSGCHRVIEIRARGLCATCYSRWRRRRRG
jgi:uncharacterized paraquat-inducible protein A